MLVVQRIAELDVLPPFNVREQANEEVEDQGPRHAIDRRHKRRGHALKQALNSLLNLLGTSLILQPQNTDGKPHKRSQDPDSNEHVGHAARQGHPRLKRGHGQDVNRVFRGLSSVTQILQERRLILFQMVGDAFGTCAFSERQQPLDQVKQFGG